MGVACALRRRGVDLVVPPTDRRAEMSIQHVWRETCYCVPKDIKGLVLGETIAQVTRRQDFLHREGEVTLSGSSIDPRRYCWIGVRGVQHLTVCKAQEGPARARPDVDRIGTLTQITRKTTRAGTRDADGEFTDSLEGKWPFP